MIVEAAVGTVSLVVAAIVDRMKRRKVFNLALAARHKVAEHSLPPAKRLTNYLIFSSTGRIRYEGSDPVDAMLAWNHLLLDDEGLGWTWNENGVDRSVITADKSNRAYMDPD